MLWIIAVGALVVTGILWWWGAQLVRHRATLRQLVERHVPSFLQQMTAGSVLMAERVEGPGFLQLALQSTSASLYDVEFGFPDDSWSRAAFDPLSVELRSAGFTVRTEAASGADITRFLRVRAYGDAPAVAEQLRTILNAAVTALAWRDDLTYIVTYRGGLKRAA